MEQRPENDATVMQDLLAHAHTLIYGDEHCPPEWTEPFYQGCPVGPSSFLYWLRDGCILCHEVPNPFPFLADIVSRARSLKEILTPVDGMVMKTIQLIGVNSAWRLPEALCVVRALWDKIAALDDCDLDCLLALHHGYQLARVFVNILFENGDETRLSSVFSRMKDPLSSFRPLLGCLIDMKDVHRWWAQDPGLLKRLFLRHPLSRYRTYYFKITQPESPIDGQVDLVCSLRPSRINLNVVSQDDTVSLLSMMETARSLCSRPVIQDGLSSLWFLRPIRLVGSPKNMEAIDRFFRALSLLNGLKELVFQSIIVVDPVLGAAAFSSSFRWFVEDHYSHASRPSLVIKCMKNPPSTVKPGLVTSLFLNHNKAEANRCTVMCR
jgi:hypothetical protein